METFKSAVNAVVRLYGKKPKYFWFFMAIFVIGIFLRTYNFHEWLEFRDDQSRDSALVGKVVDGQSSWPLLGPKMNFTGETDEKSYHIGPIYYYFQIISAKIFGNYPDKMAYPDLFFSILSIPLLYIFLRVYFKESIGLLLVSLYAFSPFFVHYSRFAWNSNLIPFFVLLFLLSLFKIVSRHEKDRYWIWVVLLGISLGVGFQLHAILMLIFPCVAFLVFLYLMHIGVRPWKELLVVVSLFLFLNGGHILNEVKTDFSNTKVLFGFSAQDGTMAAVSMTGLVKNNIECNVEANFHFLTSFGSSNCTHDLKNTFNIREIRTNKVSKFVEDIAYRIGLISGLAFSFWGYWLLVRNLRKDISNNKKFFLILLLVYSTISFLAMIPLSVDKFSDLRYSMQVFFIPYMLFGMIVLSILQKWYDKRIGIGMILLVILCIGWSYISVFRNEILQFMAHDRTCSSHSTTLGELEDVAEYLKNEAGNKTKIYIGGDKTLPVVFYPMEYLMRKNGVEPIDIGVRSDNTISDFDSPAYYMSCKSGMRDQYPFKQVNKFFIFRVDTLK